tara:strand:+ start:687 stop:1751 length:1065 start_codon:yes stop_codon:yes gene_type:complete
MAYTTINKSTAHFDTKLYAGSSSNVTVSGLEFQPDWIWLKNRSATDNHAVVDAVRGSGSYGYKNLYPNLSDGEYVPASGNASVLSIASSSFVVGQNSNTNGNGENFVAWHWKANGQGSSNTSGSINTTYTSVNTTAGFSISTYTGNGTDGATVGHGLGVAPKVVMIKNRSTASRDWIFHNPDIIGTQVLFLNTDAAKLTNSGGVADQFNTTTIRLNDGSGGAQGINHNGDNYVMYCFAEKTGYSKFGSYNGNGSTDNAFIYTGFKPTFFMTKRYSDTARWCMWDSARDPDNPVEKLIYANENSAEGGSPYLEFMSNGIKIIDGNSKWGANGSNYTYMAFGQSLVGTNNVPATAR